MPDLLTTLQGHDLGFLKIVASAWGIELNAPDAHSGLPALVNGILESTMIAEVIETLPEEAQNALHSLIQNEGRLLWATFVRQFGDLRRMGPARRDRERPDLRPAWTTEILWYRAMIGKAFLNPPGETEPQEYAYIPDDLLALMPTLQGPTPLPPGRPATPNECAQPVLVSDWILDETCTLLAAMRIGMSEAEIGALKWRIPPGVLKGLLSAAELLDYDGMPHPENTRAFLEAPRGKALALLVQDWREDKHFNELRLLPGLKFEGDWTNDALATRRAVNDLISQAPENQWWNIASFITAVHEQQPDFLRPSGDYDSWFIQQVSTGSYLRGFGSWYEVEGALLRFMITGPMHWLGLLDLAAPEAGAEPTAFRLSQWEEALWMGRAPEGLPDENGTVRVSAEGRLRLTALTPRAVRYQVARFCQWEGEQEGSPREYTYRITPAALERASVQRLRPSQFLGLLRRYCEGPFPPNLTQALERWEQTGTQAVVERVTLLRVTSVEILAALRKGRAARCLGETLNETTVLVRPGMEEHLMAALVEAGYLPGAKLEGVSGV